MTAVSLAEQRMLGALAERLVPVAAEFVGVVRDEDRDSVGRFLARLPRQERDALPVILAAMIPDDRTPADLLSWVTWDEFGRPLPADTVLMLAERKPGPALSQPCGTVSAYKRHYANGERPCEACREARNTARAAARQAREKAAA